MIFKPFWIFDLLSYKEKKDVKKFSRIFKSKNFLILPKYAYFEFRRAEPTKITSTNLNQDHITYENLPHCGLASLASCVRIVKNHTTLFVVILIIRCHMRHPSSCHNWGQKVYPFKCCNHLHNICLYPFIYIITFWINTVCNP